jgi:hypothetical protein
MDNSNSLNVKYVMTKNTIEKTFNISYLSKCHYISKEEIEKHWAGPFARPVLIFYISKL